jgi:hypothetical protein
MKGLVIVGIILIIAGILGLAIPAITYTEREQVLDLGPIQATAERERTIPISPVIAIVAIASGLVLVVVGARRTA